MSDEQGVLPAWSFVCEQPPYLDNVPHGGLLLISRRRRSFRVSDHSTHPHGTEQVGSLVGTTSDSDSVSMSEAPAFLVERVAHHRTKALRSAKIADEADCWKLNCPWR